MFKGVNCINNQPIHSVCLTEACRLSPFICEALCFCRDNHRHDCHIKPVSQLDQDIKTILKFQFFMVYSSTLRGNSIHVVGRYALQTLAPPNNQRFALTYDPIPAAESETVCFRLVRIKGCVGVGIFIREVLIRNDFRYLPDGQFLNHGAYMLLSNNLLYSHSRADQNGKSVDKFQVKQGDLVKVKYDKGRVSFSVKGREECLSVDVGPNQNLHFGVYVYEVQDEVEIVNSFVQGE